MYSRILKQAFWDFYDHLGRLLVLNLLMVFTLLPLFWFAMNFVAAAAQPLAPAAAATMVVLAFFVCTLVLGTPWLAGLFHFGHESSLERDPSLTIFFRGWKACGFKVLRTLAILAGIAAILIINFWFYLFSGMLPESISVYGGVLGGLCGWLMLSLLGVAAHALPLAVRTTQSPVKCVKTGGLLLLRFPAATFLVVFTIIGMLMLGTMLRFVGILIYGFTLPVMLANSLHDVCSDILEAEEERRAAGESQSDKPSSWREIQEDEAITEERRLAKARYNRGLRDVLRPWEM